MYIYVRVNMSMYVSPSLISNNSVWIIKKKCNEYVYVWVCMSEWKKSHSRIFILFKFIISRMLGKD